MEIGLGPSQDFLAGSATARPGHAEGGCCTEHRTFFPKDTLTSFLLQTPEKDEAPTEKTEDLYEKKVALAPQLSSLIFHRFLWNQTDTSFGAER